MKYIIIIILVVVAAVGYYWFQLPNNIICGGLAGNINRCDSFWYVCQKSNSNPNGGLLGNINPDEGTGCKKILTR